VIDPQSISCPFGWQHDVLMATSIRATIDSLAAFGLFAVTAMLVTYALEKRSPGLSWLLPVRVYLVLFTAFCRVHGNSGWWQVFGL
jgi:hypothetical protein